MRNFPSLSVLVMFVLALYVFSIHDAHAVEIPLTVNANTFPSDYIPISLIVKGDSLTTGPSAFCHITDGVFSVCPDGKIEWSDIQFAKFPQTDTFLYADQADLEPNNGTDKPEETFMLMYDECSRTTPLGPDEYVLVRFMTVDNDDTHKVEQYVLHLFTDGTIIFIEDGKIEGEGRAISIEGQQGTVAFDKSPNCPFDHVIAEFQVTLTPQGGAYSLHPLWWTSSVPDPDCTVDILGLSPIMHPGEFANLSLSYSNFIPVTTVWAVEGNIIKDYVESTNFAAFTDTTPYTGLVTTPMTPSDFENTTLSFYWQITPGDPTRTVEVRMQDAGGFTCSTEEEITVEFGADQTTQAEDYYVATNHPVAGTTAVLQEHGNWHITNNFNSATYNGTLFFSFHRAFIDNFNQWRTTFGYPLVTAWSPGQEEAGGGNPNSGDIPTGIEIDHDDRFGTYPGLTNVQREIQSEKPSWFMIDGDSLPDTDGTRPTSSLPCDALPGRGGGQDELSDFGDPSHVFDHLGCAVVFPWHNGVHIQIGGTPCMPGGVGPTCGDMSADATSPRDPLFWRWHTHVDSIRADKQSIGSPHVLYQSPHALFKFITQMPNVEITIDGVVQKIPAIAVRFDEPVRGVTAGDLTVNGSPATLVQGDGDGPYIFSGFKDPEKGTVQVNLSSGKIVNQKMQEFLGDWWTYTRVDPEIDLDDDGLIDGLEVNVYLTDPTNTDSDNDGLSDGYEANSTCLNHLDRDGEADYDNDGITNVEEFQAGTDPCPPKPRPPVGDYDDDSILNDLDNCPLVSNKDQHDKNFNGIGDICEKPDTLHGTSAFLQATENGSTFVEPRSLLPTDDPSVSEIITRIVEFELDSGMSESPSPLTENLAKSFVELELITSSDADTIVSEILDSIQFTLSSDFDGKTFTISGRSDTVKPLGFSINPNQSVKIDLEQGDGGKVELSLPTNLISDIHTIQSEKGTIAFEKISSSESFTKISLIIPNDVDSIEIIGTFVIPEFNSLVFLVLLVSIIPIILFGKTRISRIYSH